MKRSINVKIGVGIIQTTFGNIWTTFLLQQLGQMLLNYFCRN